MRGRAHWIASQLPHHLTPASVSVRAALGPCPFDVDGPTSLLFPLLRPSSFAPPRRSPHLRRIKSASLKRPTSTYLRSSKVLVNIITTNLDTDCIALKPVAPASSALSHITQTLKCRQPTSRREIKWSGSRPGGKVADVVTEGKAQVESHRGNTISKNAEPNNPAVHVSRSGNDVVKKASELDIEKEGDKHKEASGEEKTVSKGEAKKADREEEEEEEGEENDDAQTGEKRKADDAGDDEGMNKNEKGPAKKLKKDDGKAVKKQATEKKDDEAEKAAEQEANGDSEKAAPKKKGRPAKTANGTASKDSAKKREPKKAATESGEPRRSRRVANQ
nr:hypothetical protein CFP56_16474 [Quercus suber]